MKVGLVYVSCFVVLCFVSGVGRGFGRMTDGLQL